MLKWLNATKQGINFVKFHGSVKLVVVTDSAFKAQEFAGLAVRGCMIALAEVDSSGKRPVNGKVVLLDWYSRKHVHVVRST